MGVVHSSHDTIYVQEVEQIEKQENEAKDEEERKVIEKKIAIKLLERDLAWSKHVRQRNLTLRQMLYAMKLSLVVCSGVCAYVVNGYYLSVYVKDAVYMCISHRYLLGVWLMFTYDHNYNFVGMNLIGRCMCLVT